MFPGLYVYRCGENKTIYTAVQKSTPALAVHVINAKSIHKKSGFPSSSWCCDKQVTWSLIVVL